jgi:hypothetical protein
MIPAAPRRGDLAATLISHAAGLTGAAAAAELIAVHQTWLARTDFITSHIHAGTRHDGHRYAWLHRLRGRHPAHRGQPRRPRRPGPPRPRPGLTRPPQHPAGHRRHHPRERLTTAPARHHKGTRPGRRSLHVTLSCPASASQHTSRPNPKQALTRHRSIDLSSFSG